MSPEGGYFDFLRRIRLGRLAPTLLGAAVFLILLSLFTGWFSVDTTADVYDYDAAAPEGKGNFTIKANVDIEMQVLSLQTKIRPDAFDRRVEEYGKPNYDDHAGRSGTVMLGILLLSAVSLLSLLAALGFFSWHRRGRRNVGHVARRMTLLFLVLGLVTLLYFGVRIGESAKKDSWFILETYQPSKFDNRFPTLHPDQLHPKIQFWGRWTCCPAPQSVYNGKLVLVEVDSNPSAGFWLFASGELLTLTGWLLALREGQYDPKEPPTQAHAAAPPAQPKVT